MRALSAMFSAGTVAGPFGWIRLWYFVVTVRGPRTEPTLHGGGRVLARRAAPRRVRGGDGSTAVRIDRIIKRAVAVPGDPVSRRPGYADGSQVIGVLVGRPG